MDSNNSKDIFFYGTSCKYKELSNFYLLKTPIIVFGKTYATSEHLYQSMKYLLQEQTEEVIEYSELIRTATNPYKSKTLANQKISNSDDSWILHTNQTIERYKDFVSPYEDWYNIKEKAMQYVVAVKFMTDEDCRSVLLDINPEANIYEDSPYDNFWGIGKLRSGKNVLGKILETLKEEITEGYLSDLEEATNGIEEWILNNRIKPVIKTITSSTSKIKMKINYISYFDKTVPENNDSFSYFVLSGLTDSNEQIYLKVKRFKFFSYLELDFENSNSPFYCRNKSSEELKKLIKIYTDSLNNNMKKTTDDSIRSNVDVIESIDFCLRNSLVGDVPTKLVKIKSENYNQLKSLCSRTKFERTIYHNKKPVIVEYDQVKCHEHDIKPVIKFFSEKEILPAGWIEFEVSSEQKIWNVVNSKNAYTLDYDQISAINLDKSVEPSYMSFDIECYSHNFNSKLPNPTQDENVVFQIGVTYGIGFQKDQKYKKYLLTIHKIKNIVGVQVISFEDEASLLLGFRDLVNKLNPDCFIGYNILKFDWNYMIERCSKLNILDEFIKMSKDSTIPAKIETIEWKSKAYNKQSYRYLEPIGRINIDVMIEIERNYKFPKYTLDYVSSHFLGKTKKDVTPRQLFMLFKIANEYGRFTCKTDFITTKNTILNILVKHQMNGKARVFRQKIKACNSLNEIYDVTDTALQITGDYCVQDTILPVELMICQNLWITMEELSNCTNIPLTFIHTQGQSIKVFSQIYKECLKNKMFIPTKSHRAKEYFQGARVFEATPGFFDDVVVEDFASLYPSTIIAYNICYSTQREITEENEKDLTIIEWSDHVNCKHKVEDGTIKKIKSKKITICDVVPKKYGYTKVKYDSETKTIKGLGIIPRLCQYLLTERKRVKKILAKEELKLKMLRGLMTNDDLEKAKTLKIEILQPDESKIANQEIVVAILDAKQKALKVSANSIYGFIGMPESAIPNPSLAACVTAKGRENNLAAVNYILDGYKFTKLVYGDTDSCMMKFSNLVLSDIFMYAVKVSKETSKYLKYIILGLALNMAIEDFDEETKYLYDFLPIELEFEGIYRKFMQLTKKRYMALKVNIKDEILECINKGIVLNKRDNCEVLRNIYRTIKNIMLRYDENKQKRIKIEVNKNKKCYSVDEDEKIITINVDDENLDEEVIVINILVDEINKIYNRHCMLVGNEYKLYYPDTKFIIYKAIGEIKDYAKKRKDVGENEEVLFETKEGQLFKSSSVTSCLDPRLYYEKHISHVELAKKMVRRGVTIPASTRLEFVYLKNEDKDAKQGDIMEDFEYFKENKKLQGLRIDYTYYLDHQLSNPLMELMNLKYFKQEKVYIKPSIYFEKYKEFHPDLDLLKSNCGNAKDRFKDVVNKLYKRFLIDREFKDSHEELYEVVNYQRNLIFMKDWLEMFDEDFQVKKSVKLTKDNLDIGSKVKILTFDSERSERGDRGLTGIISDKVLVKVKDNTEAESFSVKVGDKIVKVERNMIGVYYKVNDNFFGSMIKYRENYERLVRNFNKIVDDQQNERFEV